MASLHNRISQKELKEKLYQENFKRITISFYQYFTIPDPLVFRDALYLSLNALRIFGRIYIANEGINAQISVPEFNLEEFKKAINEVVPSNDGDLRLNSAIDDDGKSFWVLKIKVREKIVSDGIMDPTFSMHKKGQYVNADQFNQLTNDPKTIVVDMRNHYEYEVGHFRNAIEIPSDTFRQQLPMVCEQLKKEKESHIIMYCTGGIRCEKASAYLLHQGFKNVFHLEGGIIHYANQVKEKQIENKFLGKNFVFDDRLGEKIGSEIISTCHQCGSPSDAHTNCINSGCHLLFIQCDTCKVKFENCCCNACLNQIHLPEEEQLKLRKGVDKGRNIFNKSKEKIREKIGVRK